MKRIYLILVIGVLFLSCRKINPMDRTVFIPDENDPDLPAYTEWGYNAFGAEYGRYDYFVSNEKQYPCRIKYSQDNKLHFSLCGKIKNTYENMDLTFIFDMPPMSDYKDLMLIPQNKEINLLDSTCRVEILRFDRVDTTLNLQIGTLNFKRIQMLSIDEKEDRIILSGVFDLKFKDKDDYSVYISNGRFDVGVTKKDFN